MEGVGEEERDGERGEERRTQTRKAAGNQDCLLPLGERATMRTREECRFRKHVLARWFVCIAMLRARITCFHHQLLQSVFHRDSQVAVRPTTAKS